MNITKILIYGLGVILLGVLAAFVTRNIFIGIGLPVGIGVGYLLWKTVEGMGEEDEKDEPQTPENN